MRHPNDTSASGGPATVADFSLAPDDTRQIVREDQDRIERDQVAVRRRAPPVSSSIRGAYAHPTRPRR